METNPPTYLLTSYTKFHFFFSGANLTDLIKKCTTAPNAPGYGFQRRKKSRISPQTGNQWSAPGRSVSRPSRENTDPGSPGRANQRLRLGVLQQEPPAADFPPRKHKPRHKFFWLPALGHGFHHLPRPPLSSYYPIANGSAILGGGGLAPTL